MYSYNEEISNKYENKYLSKSPQRSRFASMKTEKHMQISLKPCILFLFLLILSSFSHAQTSGLRGGWESRLVGVGGRVQVVPLPNGESVQIFERHIDGPQDTLGLLIGRFDEEGQHILQKEMDIAIAPDYMTVIEAILLSTGEVAVLGSTGNSLDYEPFVAIFDPFTLDLLNLYALDGGNAAPVLRQMMEAENGDIYLMGATQNLAAPAQGPSLIRLGRDGAVKFSKVYNYPGFINSFASTLLEVSSNHLMLLTQSNWIGPNPSQRQICFSIDTLGQVNWAKDMSLDGSLSWGRMHRTAANKLTLTGALQRSTSLGNAVDEERNTIFLEIDTTGNVLQSQLCEGVWGADFVLRDTVLTGKMSFLSPSMNAVTGLISIKTDGSATSSKIFRVEGLPGTAAPTNNGDLALQFNGRLLFATTSSDTLTSAYRWLQYRFLLDSTDAMGCYTSDTTLTFIPYPISQTALFLTETNVPTLTDSFSTVMIGAPLFSDTIFCQSNCVWPGDANGDGTANNVDLLNIGLAYGSLGPARSSISNVWTCQPATDWPQTFQSGLPYQHADCDGSGLVNDDDTLAIVQNYGLNHARLHAGVDTATLPPLLITWEEDSAFAGDTVLAYISVGDSAYPVDSLYGLAFTVHYDPSLVDSGSAIIVFDSSWLGTAANTLDLQYDRWTEGAIDAAITRTDGQNASGHGVLGHLQIVLIDNIEGKRDISKYLHLEFGHHLGVTASETQLEYASAGDSLLVVGLEIGLPAPQHPVWDFSIHPNPSSGGFELNTTGTPLERLRVYDLNGKLLRDLQPAARHFDLDLTELAEGMYVLQAWARGRTVVKRLVLQR